VFDGGDVSERTGTLAGAAGGALAGSAIGDGGLIAPALGAVGGAVIGEEVAENDPVFD
jgi:outer membrane lipoprotein SlyB